MSTVAEAPPARPGLLEWVGSTDHKRIGVALGAVALVYFLIGGILALVIRSELATPGLQIVSQDTYNQLFTMHGSMMVYLFVVPLALAVGAYFVPLQIGAAEIAAPRLALLGMWLIVSGGLTMTAGFATQHGAARAGWTAYYPLSGSERSPGVGMDLWIFGVILATAGAILLGWCVLLTILRLRAPGMTMLRMPIFSWSMLVTCLMVVMTFPVLIVAMVLLYLDRQGVGIFDSAGGPIAFQNLFWFYGHPVVYVMFFPFVGAVGEVIAVFSRRRFFGYQAMVISLLLFAGLSMSVWAHHMFATGQSTNQYFALTSTALIVPAGIEYFDLVGTMIGGSILLRTPMLFALAFLLQFLIGGLTGVMLGSPPIDYHVTDTFFVVGHFHYTAVAGSVFGFFAGFYYWFPKVAGVFLREGLGKLHWLLMVIGVNLTFFPMHILGYEGMPRRIADYSPSSGFEGWNIVSTVGAFLIALSILVFLVNVVLSLARREPAGPDPWGGHTLEWATTSPPPRHNFESLPPIRSYAPLLDLRGSRELSVPTPRPARSSGAAGGAGPEGTV